MGSDSQALTAYMREIGRTPLLTIEEERYFAANKHHRWAREKLVTANLRFVVKIANEYRSYGFRLADLIQEGNIGLMKAVDKFDVARNLRMTTYSVWWIRAYIQLYITRNWSLVKIGTTNAERTLFFKIAGIVRRLEHNRTGEISDAEIAEYSGMKEKEVHAIRARHGQRDWSLNAPMSSDESNDATFLDFVVSATPSQEDQLIDLNSDRYARRVITEALGKLKPIERDVISMRMLRDPPLKLAEVGERFGFTRERARQIEIRGLNAMARHLGSDRNFKAIVGVLR